MCRHSPGRRAGRAQFRGLPRQPTIGGRVEGAAHRLGCSRRGCGRGLAATPAAASPSSISRKSAASWRALCDRYRSRSIDATTARVAARCAPPFDDIGGAAAGSESGRESRSRRSQRLPGLLQPLRIGHRQTFRGTRRSSPMPYPARRAFVRLGAPAKPVERDGFEYRRGSRTLLVELGAGAQESRNRAKVTIRHNAAADSSTSTRPHYYSWIYRRSYRSPYRPHNSRHIYLIARASGSTNIVKVVQPANSGSGRA